MIELVLQRGAHAPHRSADARAAATAAPFAQHPGLGGAEEPVLEPRPEIIDAADLRWIHIEEPRLADRLWLAENFEFHELDLEDVASRNQRPKVDEYPDYLFLVMQFPRYDKATGRLHPAELDVFIGGDYVITLPNEPIPPLAQLFERVRGRPEVREELMTKGSGRLLYEILDRCVDAGFPMLGTLGRKLRDLEEDIFMGRSAGGRARDQQREAGDHQLPRRHPAAAGRLPLARARQAALHERGAGDLLRRPDRCLRAHLGRARELQGDRRGPGEHERVGHLAPPERRPARAHRGERHPAAADPPGEHLRHERRLSRRGQRRSPSGSSSAPCSPSSPE